jgi:hypothetical protein
VGDGGAGKQILKQRPKRRRSDDRQEDRGDSDVAATNPGIAHVPVARISYD